MNTSMSTLHQLPTELLFIISDDLSTKDIFSLRLVSQLFSFTSSRNVLSPTAYLVETRHFTGVRNQQLFHRRTSCLSRTTVGLQEACFSRSMLPPPQGPRTFSLSRVPYYRSIQWPSGNSTVSAGTWSRCKHVQPYKAFTPCNPLTHAYLVRNDAAHARV
jgi:hypothetical protein